MAHGLQAGFRLGNFAVVPDAGEIRGGSGVAVLHPQTMKVLVFLAEHAGELVSSERIRQTIWPSASVSDETVRRCIKELRHRLHDDANEPRYLETIENDAYRLIAKVTPSQSVPPEHEPSPVQRFLGQLQRRKVFRVIAGYTIVGWLLMQVMDVVSEAIPWIPDNAMQILIVVLAAGFPVAVVLAWWLEITDRGVVLDPETAARFPKMARIWRPVAVGAALAAATGFAAFIVTREGIFEGERLAAAVLPFDDLSAAESENSCGWLTEEMTDVLANIQELRVSARKSSESLAAANLPVPEIAERLRVGYVLEGSCGADEDRLRITAQLIEAEEGFHLWSQVYDVPWSDRLKVVREIARKIAVTLNVALSAESERRLGRIPTSNQQAYVNYQQGQSFLERNREAEYLGEAEKLFRNAIHHDEGFAEAYAGLCKTYLSWYQLERSVARYREAEKACVDALEAEYVAPQVYVALGDLYRHGGEYKRAYDSFWRAAELDDLYVDAHIGSARALALLDRPAEAESEFRRAIDLEPGYWVAYNAYGRFLLDKGRHDEAAIQFLEVITLTPENASGYNNLGGAYFLSGRFDEAATAFEQSLGLDESRSAHSNAGTMYFYAGRFTEAAEHYRAALAYAPEDYRMWGHLGDALYARGDAESMSAFEKAVMYADSALSLNRADSSARARLAYFKARLGHSDYARRQIEIAVNTNPEDMYVQYDAALVFDSLGDSDSCLIALEQAVKIGYPPSLVAADPLLTDYACTGRFKSIASAGSDEASTRN